MTREADAAVKAWIVSVGGASLDEAYSAGHAAADTDAKAEIGRLNEALDFVAAEREAWKIRAQALRSLCIEMRDWLKPELEREPDRTFFWRLVEVINRAFDYE